MTHTTGPATAASFDAWMSAELAAVEAKLDQLVVADTPAGLGEVMRYGVLDGGKRLRPMLALAAALAVQGQREAALRAACAAEWSASSTARSARTSARIMRVCSAATTFCPVAASVIAAV